VSSDVNIWHMRIDGTGKTQVTDLPSWDSWPRWGQDGIYFLSGRGKGNNNTVSIWRIKM
jgi:Tol biopolymer transport system component